MGSSLYMILVCLSVLSICFLWVGFSFLIPVYANGYTAPPLPVMKDASGNELKIAKVGQTVVLSSYILNIWDHEQEFVSIMEARDQDGVTVFLAWQSGILNTNSGIEIGSSWTPGNSGKYQLRTFMITSFANPQILSPIAVSDITISESSANGSLVVLTDDKLLSLTGGVIEFEKHLDKDYSEVQWDGKNLYLAKILPSHPDDDYASIDSEILVLNQNLSEINRFQIDGPIHDFAAQNSIVYVLTENKFQLLNTNNQETETDNTSSRISFTKPNHDIMLSAGYAYLLDNIAVPLYIHIVDLSSLELYTHEFTGVNAHLAAQDVIGDKWYVLESMHVMTGYFQNLHAFSSKPEDLEKDPERYTLVGIEHYSPPETAYRIASIKMGNEDNTVYALGYGVPYNDNSAQQRSENELMFMIYSLDSNNGAKQLAALGLEESVNLDQYRFTTNIVLGDNKAYVGGENGVYVINLDDLTKPYLEEFIPTDSPVRFLTHVDE
nr:hypothetical protein Josef01_05d18_36 [uncultured archaeon]